MMSWVELDVSTKGYPGVICKVDAEDLDRISGMKWGVAMMGSAGHKRPYVRTRIGGRNNSTFIRLHRLVMDAPKGVEVDHINGDTLDNRKSNLRFASRLEQSRNTGMRKNSSTVLKGVNMHTGTGKYRAYITVNRRQIHLGLYDTPEEAGDAYDQAATRLFGEFARLNGSCHLKSH